MCNMIVYSMTYVDEFDFNQTWNEKPFPKLVLLFSVFCSLNIVSPFNTLQEEDSLLTGPQKVLNTRMHSSRMHTVRCSGCRGKGGVSQHALGRGGCLPGGGCLPRGDVCPNRDVYPGVCPVNTGIHPLWTEWPTDRCKNISFPQLRLRTVMTLIIKQTPMN